MLYSGTVGMHVQNYKCLEQACHLAAIYRVHETLEQHVNDQRGGFVHNEGPEESAEDALLLPTERAFLKIGEEICQRLKLDHDKAQALSFDLAEEIAEMSKQVNTIRREGIRRLRCNCNLVAKHVDLINGPELVGDYSPSQWA
jgi:hypothetical protein